MVRQRHQFDGHEFEQTLENNRGQKCLVCCSPWGRKESDLTQQRNTATHVLPLLPNMLLPDMHTPQVFSWTDYSGDFFLLISVLYISTCFCLNFNFTPETARPRKIELTLIKKYSTGTQEKTGSWYVRKRKGVGSQDCNTSYKQVYRYHLMRYWCHQLLSMSYLNLWQSNCPQRFSKISQKD